MTKRGAERLPVGSVIWTCDPNAILCPDDHFYWHKDGGMKRDMRRMAGHDFFRCEICQPPTHFFAVFSTSPDPHVSCYLISEDCWRQWVNDPNPQSLSTQEMLHVLRDPLGRSYLPYFKEPRNAADR